MTRQSFRRLIILQWLLGLSAVAVSWVTNKHLPPELRAYWEARMNAESEAGASILVAVSLAVLFASVIIDVGLYRFRPWAKALLLPSHIIALVMMPLYGPTVLSGWVEPLNYLYSLVNGGILFLVYWSPVSRMFATDGDV